MVPKWIRHLLLKTCAGSGSQIFDNNRFKKRKKKTFLVQAGSISFKAVSLNLHECKITNWIWCVCVCINRVNRLRLWWPVSLIWFAVYRWHNLIHIYTYIHTYIHDLSIWAYSSERGMMTSLSHETRTYGLLKYNDVCIIMWLLG